MKKTLLFAFAAAALFASCGEKETKTTDVQTEAEEVVALPDSSECVNSAEVVYVDLDAIFKSSKIFEKEGKPLETKMEAFQKKAMEKENELVQLGQSIEYEQSRINQDGSKVQSDYQKGLMTTLNYQAKMQELEKRAQNLQVNAAAYQQKQQKAGEELQKEQQELGEAQIVLENRFTELTKKAIEEINADGRYKMVINSMMVINAADGLNISSLVLAKVDELYEAGAITK